MEHFYCYYDNGLKNHYINETYVIKDGEVKFSTHPTEAQLKAAFPLYEDKKAESDILTQISALESTITTRRIREAALGTDNGWMEAIDAQIAALRAQL